MTQQITDFTRRKLSAIERMWEVTGHIEGGSVSFLIRMAHCYLREPEPAPTSDRPSSADLFRAAYEVCRQDTGEIQSEAMDNLQSIVAQMLQAGRMA